MTSSDSESIDPWADVFNFPAWRGWSGRVVRACRQFATCDCCNAMEVGCLCEATMVNYELSVAEREMERARDAYDAWFTARRQPQIEAARWSFQLQRRRRRRRLHRRQRERRRRIRERFAGHNWSVLGETGGTPAVPDEEDRTIWAVAARWNTVDEAIEDGVWGWSPLGGRGNEEGVLEM